jgi:hypothetical protein
LPAHRSPSTSLKSALSAKCTSVRTRYRCLDICSCHGCALPCVILMRVGSLRRKWAPTRRPARGCRASTCTTGTWTRKNWCPPIPDTRTMPLFACMLQIVRARACVVSRANQGWTWVFSRPPACLENPLTLPPIFIYFCSAQAHTRSYGPLSFAHTNDDHKISSPHSPFSLTCSVQAHTKSYGHTVQKLDHGSVLGSLLEVCSRCSSQCPGLVCNVQDWLLGFDC